MTLERSPSLTCSLRTSLTNSKNQPNDHQPERPSHVPHQAPTQTQATPRALHAIRQADGRERVRQASKRDQFTPRCVLVCYRTHDLVTEVSSKSHDAFRVCLVRVSLGSALPDMVSARLASPPRAFTVSGALPATIRLMAAFKSRSIDKPHTSHW